MGFKATLKKFVRDRKPLIKAAVENTKQEMVNQAQGYKSDDYKHLAIVEALKPFVAQIPLPWYLKFVRWFLCDLIAELLYQAVKDQLPKSPQ